MRARSCEDRETLAKQKASEQNPIHALVREAVDQKVALWQKLREIEKTLGFECDGLEDIIEEWAAAVDNGSDISPASLDEVIQELNEVGQTEGS